jgi:type IV pilus assembly protein PilA
MFCFKCGASMPDQTPACPKCGAAISSAPPPAASSSAAAPAPAPVSPRVNLAQSRVHTGPQETDGKAVGSLILGILAMFPLGLLAGIPAVILGHLSRKSIRESLGRLKGDGMALAGLIMGYLSLAAIPIILIIAAIAIPSLLRAKMQANESAAMSTVRTLNTSQAVYSTKYPTTGYARDLATLGPGSASSCTAEPDGSAEHACLIDGVLGNPSCTSGSWCAKGGYKYSVTAECGTDGACTGYVVVATPLQPGTSGAKSFCSTSDLVVRFKGASRTIGAIVTPLTVEECQSWPAVL